MGKKKRSRTINKRHADILRALQHFSAKERAAFFRAADTKLVRCVCECVFNVLCGNVPIHSKHKIELKKHASVLRKLVEKKNGRRNLVHKRRLIMQNGGFLPTLLIPILKTLAQLM